MKHSKRRLLVSITAMMLCVSGVILKGPASPVKKVVKAATNVGKVALKLNLPVPIMGSTPKNISPGVRLDKSLLGKHRGPFYVPPGLTNVALHKPVTSSDTRPIIGSLELVTDGDKQGTDGSWVTLAPGKQWVQIDLQKTYSLYALVVWHYHNEARIYHDVVVQISDDPNFAKDVHTVFNNDVHNELGLGTGKDYDYFENNEGKLIDTKGVKGRYVRLWSNGNTSDDENNYTEVEVYGK
ncbi:MAG: discoidin domain-containing protein [Abitibacteriaceae bacterium]|nr:discoidin domain-containing protein [Abditibacteriaceae bacterium]